MTLAILCVLSIAVVARGQAVQFGEETFAYDRDKPAIGYWIGNVQIKGQTTFAAIEIKPDGQDAAAAEVMLLAMGAVNTACDAVKISDREVSLSFQAMGPRTKFAGAVSDDGQRLIGTFSLINAASGAETPLGEAELARSVRATSLPAATAYTGELEIQGLGSLRITVVLAPTPAGNWVGQVDVPQQALFAMPLINITKADDGAITATLPIPVAPATIVAKVDQDDQRLHGSFKQGTFDLALDLKRDAGYVPPTLSRPQHPKPPFPYDTREVRIAVPAGFELAGTLTLPKTDHVGAKHPLAILISGSGQQDRDETLMGHKPFLVVADYLTRHGIAVFRYDDRGVGGSGGAESVKQATSADFAQDVGAIVEHFKTQPEIDATKIGLIGHSEGGMIAPMVAAQRDDIAFIVLLAGTGVTGREILELQGPLIMEAEGVDPAEVDRFRQTQRTLLDLVQRGASDEEIRQAASQAIDSANKQAGADAAGGQPGEAAADGDQAKPEPSQIAEMQVHALTLPWMKFFLSYDPRPTFAKVACPVLALNGTRDLQVWHEQNLPEIEKAIRQAGGDVTAKRYDGLNHLFQPAKTGGVSEYATIETTFDESVLRDIVSWLDEKVGLVAAQP